MSNSTSATGAATEARLTGAARDLGAAGITAIAWAGVGVAALFFALRLVIRYRENARFFSDDYWLGAAFTVLIVNATLQTLQTQSLFYILNVSIGRIPAGEGLLVQGNIYVRYEFPIIGLFWTILWCVKASFLALFWRLFDGLPAYRRMWWVVVVFSVLAYIGCWIASAWTCHPPSNYFHFGQCSKPIDQVGSIISISYSTAVDILTDLMIMSLPLRLLRDLQVTRPQKIGLMVVFCVGFAIIAVAIVRLTQIVGKERADPVGLAVWGLVESTVSVIVGCLPPLKSFFSKQIRKFTGAVYGYGHSGGQHSGKGQGGSGGGGGRSPFASARGKSTGGRGRSESIPLDDNPGAKGNVAAIKNGHIIVQKDFGWTASDPDGSTSLRTDRTEAHSDEQNYGDEVRMVNPDPEAPIGVAHSVGRKVDHGASYSYQVGHEESADNRGKTSWLR